VYFQAKKLRLGNFLEGLRWETVHIFYGHLGYFMAIWDILWPFGIFYGHLGYFMAICYILCSFWYIFSSFGIMSQEKSGNPELEAFS
jgi:hypothetical protein